MASLPAPIFPEATGGTIPIESVTSAGRVRVSIPILSGLGVNDLITLLWNDIPINWYTVPMDNPPQPIEFNVPSTLAPIGSYWVSYTIDDFANATRSSAIANLQITVSSPVPIGQLRMILTTNASNYERPTIDVMPFNRGVVYGPPSTTVVVTVSSPGLIEETGRNNFLAVIDESGELDFSIFSAVQGLLTVTAYSALAPTNSVTLTTFIGPYRLGAGRIKSVNYSTGAPANNRTYNSIYLKTEALYSEAGPAITEVNAIIIEGSARITGSLDPQRAVIYLNLDQSATINLTSVMSERTIVELSLPRQSGSEKRIQTIFVQPPY